MLHVISLGAGVQSSVLALMAAKGEITPMPRCAVFADTATEPQAVYDWLTWLEKQLPFPVYRRSKGNLGRDGLKFRISRKTGVRYNRGLIPVFIKNPEGKTGIVPRKCTKEYKIDVIHRFLRNELLSLSRISKKNYPDPLVTQWIGISRDEAHRIKPSRDHWIINRWPLVDSGISRQDCLDWMKAKGFPKPPRSACVFCPYHSNSEWLELKADDPKGFSDAVQWEAEYQKVFKEDARTPGIPYLHPSLVSLNQVQFDLKSPQLNLFGNECEGMCGV